MGFKFTLRSRDERFKITYSDYRWLGAAHPSYLSSQYTKDSYDQSFDEINKDLLSFLLNGSVDNW